MQLMTNLINCTR